MEKKQIIERLRALTLKGRNDVDLGSDCKTESLSQSSVCVKCRSTNEELRSTNKNWSHKCLLESCIFVYLWSLFVYLCICRSVLYLQNIFVSLQIFFHICGRHFIFTDYTFTHK